MDIEKLKSKITKKFKNVNDYNKGLYRACHNNRVDIAEFLISGGANDFSKGMVIGTIQGHIDIVKLMINQNNLNMDWYSGIIHAFHHGHTDILKLFISKKIANPNIIMHWDDIMLNSAAYGHTDLVKLSISYGADNFNKCMNFAAYNGRTDIVKLLKPYVTYGVEDYNKCLMGACNNNHTEIIKLMISYGANDWNRLKNTTDYGLYCLYRKNTGVVPKTSRRFITVVKQYPVYVVLLCQTRSNELRRLSPDIIKKLHTCFV